MKVLGVDPGSRITGFGVIDWVGSKLTHIDNGCIIPHASALLPDRLEHIYHELMQVITRFQPEVLALEQIFVAKNARSALVLGHARGAIMLAGMHAKIPVVEYGATEVKKALVGFGAAKKEQMQRMTKALLGLPEIAMEDAADALAVAICHCQSSKLRHMLEGRRQ